MRYTLALDASTAAGSAAVLRARAVVAEEAVRMREPGAERLLPAVVAVLERADIPVSALERIACGAGPGSFTSLRIAAGIAKGLAMAAQVPIVAVPSLLLAVGAAAQRPAGGGALGTTAAGHAQPDRVRAGRYVAVLPALRGEHYAAAFELGENGDAMQLPVPPLVPSADIEMLAHSLGAVLVSTPPHARGVGGLAAWLARQPQVNLAAWEPAYGRPAEAQARWEAAHGRPLPSS